MNEDRFQALVEQTRLQFERAKEEARELRRTWNRERFSFWFKVICGLLIANIAVSVIGWL